MAEQAAQRQASWYSIGASRGRSTVFARDQPSLNDIEESTRRASGEHVRTQ
jgi:hypothetical protein